jgi:hypothetical protein
MLEELENIAQKTNVEIKKVMLGEYEINKLIGTESSKSDIQNCYDGSDGGCTGCYCDDSNYIKDTREG